MLAEYTGVLIVLVAGLVIVGALMAIHLLVGPRRDFDEKQEPFECGEKQIAGRADAWPSRARARSEWPR